MDKENVLVTKDMLRWCIKIQKCKYCMKKDECKFIKDKDELIKQNFIHIDIPRKKGK